MDALDKIIEEAESRGMNLHSLCKAAKVSYQSVWRCVKGKNSNITADTLGKLVEALDMEIIIMKRGVMDGIFTNITLTNEEAADSVVED